MSDTGSIDEQDSGEKKSVLPYRKAIPVLAGVLLGVGMRLVFSGRAGSPYAAMMGVFILCAPIAIGAVTVYVAEKQQRRSWGYYFASAAAANILVVLGTVLIMIEGWVCAIIIMPLAAIVGGLAGVVMGAICRSLDWPGSAVSGFVMIPLVAGGFPSHEEAHSHLHVLERSRVIAASPPVIWRQIQNVRDVQPEEMSRAWVFRIGVPAPLSGISITDKGKHIRRITMAKAVHFDEVVAEWEENRYVRWLNRFDPDSFPPDALDDHVRIGGRYFDVVDTAYRLTPAGPGSEATVLTVRMTYRVSTEFNWYTDNVAWLLMGNLEDTLLDFYAHRVTGRPMGAG